MDLNLFLPPVVAASIVVLGWAVVYRYFIRLKRVERIRELRLTLLMDTYQDLVFAVNNGIVTQEDFDQFYRAMQNVWLVGTPEHIELAEKGVKDVANQANSKALNRLLYLLHNEIRLEFGLSKTEFLLTLIHFGKKTQQDMATSNVTGPVSTSTLEK